MWRHRLVFSRWLPEETETENQPCWMPSSMRHMEIRYSINHRKVREAGRYLPIPEVFWMPRQALICVRRIAYQMYTAILYWNILTRWKKSPSFWERWSRPTRRTTARHTDMWRIGFRWIRWSIRMRRKAWSCRLARQPFRRNTGWRFWTGNRDFRALCRWPVWSWTWGRSRHIFENCGGSCPMIRTPELTSLSAKVFWKRGMWILRSWLMQKRILSNWMITLKGFTKRSAIWMAYWENTMRGRVRVIVFWRMIFVSCTGAWKLWKRRLKSWTQSGNRRRGKGKMPRRIWKFWRRENRMWKKDWSRQI